jgi:mycothiol synthase
VQPEPTFRPAAPDDLGAAAEIFAAEEEAIRGQTQWTPAALAEWWRMIDHEHDAFLAVAERPCAIGVLLRRGDVFDAFGAVVPGFWGRGLGTATLERLEGRARELGASRLNHDAYAENARGRALLERAGYRFARHYYTMEIDLDDPPLEPLWPPGLRVATFSAEDAVAFHATLTEAFADEWHFVPMSFERWKALRLDHPETDTSLWFLVRDGDQVAAAVRVDAERAGAGWIGAIGVRKPWRRRGIGRALLLHAFGELHRRGLRRARLGVDSQNATGATRLYERVGMHVVHEEVLYEKELG